MILDGGNLELHLSTNLRVIKIRNLQLLSLVKRKKKHMPIHVFKYFKVIKQDNENSNTSIYNIVPNTQNYFDLHII